MDWCQSTYALCGWLQFQASYNSLEELWGCSHSSKTLVIPQHDVFICMYVIDSPSFPIYWPSASSSQSSLLYKWDMKEPVLWVTLYYRKAIEIQKLIIKKKKKRNCVFFFFSVFLIKFIWKRFCGDRKV